MKKDLRAGDAFLKKEEQKASNQEIICSKRTVVRQ